MEGGVKRIDYDIFVTNIPNEAEEDIIRALFSSDGTKVKSVRFLPPKMPNAKASFVSFYSLNDAQNAVMKYNGKEIMRNKINVVLSRKTVEQVHDKPKAMDSVFSWMNGTSSSQNGSCGDEFSPTPTVKKTSPNGSVISSSTNTALLNKLKSFQKRAASVQLPDFEWESEAVLKCDVILEINSGEGCTGLFSKSKNDEDQFYRLTQEISTIDKNSLKSLTESEKNGLKKFQCFLYDQSRVELLQTTANGWLAFKVDEGKLCEINSLENLNHIPTGFLRDCPKMTTLCLPANNYVEFGEAYFNLLQELPYVALHSHMLCKYKGQKDELGRRFVVFVDEKGSVLCPGSEKNSTKAFTRLKISSLTEKHYSKAAILHLVSATEFYLAPDSPKLLSMFQDVTTLDPVPYQIIENELNPGHCCAVLHDGEFFRASLIKKIKERDGIALSLFFNDYGNSVETRTTPRFQQNSHTAVIFYLPPEEEYHSSSLAILCSLNSTNLIIPESKRKQALELVDDYVIGKLVSIEVFQNGTVDVKPEGQSQSLNHYLTSKGFGGKMPVLNNGEQILNKNVKYPTDTSPVIDLCDGMDVRIVHVAESSFYVIRIIDNKDFQKLMVDLGKIKVNKESVATKDAKCGFWYLTQCTQSGMYNRCILLKIEASNFTVQHLDSGEITKTSKIYPLPEEFKKIPAFALACHFDVPTKDPQGVYKVLKRFYTELSTMNAIVLNKSTVAGTKQYCVELNFEEDGENIKLPHVLIEGNNSNSSNNSTKDSKSETNGPTCLNDTNEKWKIDMEMRVTNIEKKLDEMSTLLLAMVSQRLSC